MRLTVLGTGTSFGIPQIGCSCRVCTSPDPRDRRSRTAAVLQSGAGTILVDTPTELRLQLTGNGIRAVDAVLYTHEHADHIAGIDDLRAFSLRRDGGFPVFGPAATLETLRQQYRYIFDETVRVPAGTSKPRLTLHPIPAGSRTRIAGVDVLPLALDHGHSIVFGYRFGQIAYLTDVKRVDPDAVSALRGVRALVLSALWWREHPTHQSIPEAVAVARAIGAERTWLTHLTHETAHADLLERLPSGIEPAYDGLIVEEDG